MEYRLLSNPEEIRCSFMEQFVESYEEFRERHIEWIARLHTEFNEEYYDKMFMWDRIIKNACEVSFADALEGLKDKEGEVLFLTESPRCNTRQFCRLDNQNEFVAMARRKILLNVFPMSGMLVTNSSNRDAIWLIQYSRLTFMSLMNRSLGA